MDIEISIQYSKKYEPKYMNLIENPFIQNIVSGRL